MSKDTPEGPSASTGPREGVAEGSKDCPRPQTSLTRARDRYVAAYLHLLRTSLRARRYVREQLAGGVWALRMPHLEREEFRWQCRTLQMPDELPDTSDVANPEAMVRELVVAVMKEAAQL